MRDLDDTDLEILELLYADARRPYKEIADQVDLTPPAVSDRIARLEEQGIIRGFTIDIDHEMLRDELPVLVELEAKPESVDAVYNAATALPGVNSVAEGMDGRIIVQATVPDGTTRSWLESELDLGLLTGYDVTLLARSADVAGLSAAGFSLECLVCGKEISGNGVTATIDGDVKTFCCPSCEDRYRSEYESHQAALE